jgi:hypothetical protein
MRAAAIGGALTEFPPTFGGVRAASHPTTWRRHVRRTRGEGSRHPFTTTTGQTRMAAARHWRNTGGAPLCPVCPVPWNGRVRRWLTSVRAARGRSLPLSDTPRSTDTPCSTDTPRSTDSGAAAGPNARQRSAGSHRLPCTLRCGRGAAAAAAAAARYRAAAARARPGQPASQPAIVVAHRDDDDDDDDDDDEGGGGGGGGGGGDGDDDDDDDSQSIRPPIRRASTKPPTPARSVWPGY